MIKRAVIRVAARGYVDGRYIGEEREEIEAIDPSGRGKRRRNKRQGEIDGNRAKNKDGTRKRGKGARPGAGGNAFAKPRGGKKTRGIEPGNAAPSNSGVREDGFSGQGIKARRNRGGKNTPFRTGTGAGPRGTRNEPALLPSDVTDQRRGGDEIKTGQFAEALQREARTKRERLHKVLAQSGFGSRRDMEIMISSGRVMVNGIVATVGMSVSPNDNVSIDHRPAKLKFGEELPRILLYHKPEGEIVTTDDPGNRITVFDNLPRVETGKWIAIGRLDINTSGLLIFTTSGELANRLMHPRYEVEREYAVRVLGELSDEQTATLLSGVSITDGDTVEADADFADEADDAEETGATAELPPADRPAKFESIDKRGGEGANRWYHVVIKEGRNREVRRMFEAVGLTVSRLLRVRFGKITLPPRLMRGRMMELDAAQVRAVLQWVGMETDGPVGVLPSATFDGMPTEGRGKGGRSGLRRRKPYFKTRSRMEGGDMPAAGDAADNAGNRLDTDAAPPEERGRTRNRRPFGARKRPVTDDRNAPPAGADAFAPGARGDSTPSFEGGPPAETNGNRADSAEAPSRRPPGNRFRGRRRFRMRRKPTDGA